MENNDYKANTPNNDDSDNDSKTSNINRDDPGQKSDPDVTEESNNIHGKSSDQKEDEPAGDGQKNKEPEPQPAEYAFRWNWTDNQKNDSVGADASINAGARKRKKLSGGALFAIIMAGVFLVAFIALAVSLITDTLITGPDGEFGKTYVNINVSDLGPTSPENGSASSEALENFKNSTVVIQTTTPTGTATGSGIILTEDGYIATNYHVIENSVHIYTTLYSGKRYNAELIGYSEKDDLAVLKIEADNLAAATFGKSSDCALGEKVYAVGSPAGADFGWTVTAGVISCVERTVNIYDDYGTLEKRMNVIQTDVSVNPGNSGGPLINSRCEVIGIVTLKLADDYVGMGFAIPSDGALEIISAIIEGRDFDSSVSSGRPLVGIVGVSVNENIYYRLDGDRVVVVSQDYAEKNPDTTFFADVTGVYVIELTEGLDAKNKLQVGDIITEIDGSAVYTIYDLSSIINQKNGGDTVSVTAYRDGKYIQRNIILGTEE